MSKRDLAQFNIPMKQVPKDSKLLQGLPADPVQAEAAYRQRLQFARAMALLSKDRATYWLGLLALDRQEFKVAGDFLKINVEDAESIWAQGARYNLARSLEAIGIREDDDEKIRKAIELYEQDVESPQRAGNLIRAERLKSKP